MLISSFSRSAWTVLPALAFLALAACGGGGGGGGSSSGSSSGGSARNLTLTLTSGTTLDFSAQASQTGSPGAQPIGGTVTGTASGTLYVLVTSDNPAVANVGTVTIGTTGATADIIPAAVETLGPGQHTATITVRACLNSPTCASNEISGSPKTVAVSYRVTGTKSTVNSLTYNVGNTVLPADLTRAFSVSSFPVNGWTASSDLPFLNVTPGNGGTALSTAVTGSIDAASLDSLSSGTYTGRVRFTPTAVGLNPFDVPVTVNVARTRVNFVAPHAAVAGRADDVIIRGESFNAVAPTGVLFGTTPATSFTLVSNTEIRARHPALTAGAYTVHLVNAAAVDRTNAVLYVVNGGAKPAIALNYPDGVDALPFTLLQDARRDALLVQLFYNVPNANTMQIVRYGFSGGSWTQNAKITVPYRSSMALSANGEVLYVAHGAAATFSVEERDPVTLALLRTNSADNSYHEAFSMAVANDGNVLIHTNSTFSSTSFEELLFSPLRHTIQWMIRPGGNATIPPMRQDSGPTVASGDGSVVLIAETQNQTTERYVSGSLETAYFDPTFVLRPYFLELVMNRRGTLMVSREDGVYDANFSRIGFLPNTTQLFGISPDQPRAYTFDQDGTIRKFDTSATPVGGFLHELTPAITPTVDPDVLFGLAPMVVSPDGLTTFVAGRDKLLVQPLQ